jgi:uncharacterized protein
MKTKLYAMLSPAKLMDETQRYLGKKCSQPHFLEASAIIDSELKKKSISDLKKMLATSDELTQQTAQRIQEWKTPITQKHSTLAIHLFKGEVYRGLDATTMTEDDLEFANEHVGILSGLYGILRAKDLVLPYRLMMGTSFAPTKEDQNLYRFWSQKITNRINEMVDHKGYIIQLASEEYFKVIDKKTLSPSVITCDFLEEKNGSLKMISTFAKQARGMMARYIIDHRITAPNDLKRFNTSGYSLQKQLSTASHLVFSRRL